MKLKSSKSHSPSLTSVMSLFVIGSFYVVRYLFMSPMEQEIVPHNNVPC